MTNEPEWMERWEKFSETVSADFIQPGFGANEEVKEFIKEEIEKAKAELLSKIEEEVEAEDKKFYVSETEVIAYKKGLRFALSLLSKYKAL